MLITSIFLILLAAGGAFQGSAYSYNVTMTIANGNQTLSANSPSSPYNSLLNQNLFLNDSRQTTILESVELNGLQVAWQISNDSEGNPAIMIPGNDPLQPGMNATLEMSFDLYLSKPSIDLTGIGNISEIPPNILSQYPLTGSWNVSSMWNGQQIIETAKAIKGGDENTLTVVYNILDWFENNMVYNSSLPYPQQVSQTFATHSGDCDDQSNLFITFCRILGIPAYLSVGPIYLPGNDVESDNNLYFNLTNVGWHGWAMVYLPTTSGGEWVPVDLTFFDGATASDGHIKSHELSQHITGSALEMWNTAEYSVFRTSDYVGDSNDQRDIILGTNMTWTENHIMSPLTQALSVTPPDIVMPSLVLIVLALGTFLVFTLRGRTLRKTRDGQHLQGASSRTLKG